MQGNPDRIAIAILALGGQGGGVLADWIQEVARDNGWIAQGTSVPGVAQRTGSTVYYVELARRANDRRPVMAQMPLPGDVDIVIASELMETGRAVLRGFSSAGRTTLIGSTHRIYAISEKSAMGDGRGSSDRILAAAAERSKRFIGFDMEAATERSGSMISSVMFGALAGSGVLPFTRESFEQAIRAGGKAVESNLKGFAEGFGAAQASAVSLPVEPAHAPPEPTTAAGKLLAERIARSLPDAAHTNALHGVARLIDYQDADYAALYIDRLEAVAWHDAAPFELTAETARYLALWMSYEDTIRVADLKTRASRMARVRGEIRLSDGQLLGVTEFMHPRLQEVCETLPAPLGRAILSSPRWQQVLGRFFREGRHVETTRLRWFLVLRMLAGMRGLRRRSLRFVEEQTRIEEWLELLRSTACKDRVLATELARCQRLIKGYGDTFERGLHNFNRIVDAHRARPDIAPDAISRLREAALAEAHGEALARELAELAL